MQQVHTVRLQTIVVVPSTVPDSMTTETGKVMNRYVYTFRKNNSTLTMYGPYENETEAGEAFQRVNGYWPGPAVLVSEWETAPDED
jgi:hypothetical protein